MIAHERTHVGLLEGPPDEERLARKLVNLALLELRGLEIEEQVAGLRCLVRTLRDHLVVPAGLTGELSVVLAGLQAGRPWVA